MLNNIFKSETLRLFAKNASWSLMGSVLPKVSILVTSIFLARILGTSAFGELSIVRSTINMFTAFATAGIGLTATKFVSQFSDDNLKVGQYISLSNFASLFFGSILLFFVFMFSSEIAEGTLKIPHLNKEIQLGAIMLFFNSVNSSQVGILSGFQNFKAVAVNSVLAVALTMPIQIVGAYYYGVFGALGGFTLSFIALYLLNYFSIRKELMTRKIKITRGAYKKVLATLWGFTLPSALSGLLVTPVLWLTTVILVRSANGTFEMGLYEAANQIKMVIIFIPVALSQILLPMLVKIKGSTKEYQRLLNKNLLLNFVISLVICIPIVMLAPYIMKLYGKTFAESHRVLTILALSTILMAVNNVIGQAIASMDRMWVGVLFNSLWGLTLVGGAYYFVNVLSMGSLGLAYAFLVSYILHTLWQYIYLKRIVYARYNPS